MLAVFGWPEYGLGHEYGLVVVGGLAVSVVWKIERWIVVEADGGWVVWWMILVPSVY